MSIKLNLKAFQELTKGLKDSEIAERMGISTVQLWRVRLPDDDPRHNDPGEDFIAGLLSAFPGIKFEDVFILNAPLRKSNVSL
ncbi:MAG: helix-turn-helix domain-containing protein [Firmicutes bacterium]|nr:helix-turn-helix domain-containing protein [Bacillota bacterium]